MPLIATAPLAPSPAQGVSRYDFLYSQLTSLLAGAATQLEIKTQQDSVFIVQTLMAKSTGLFSARFNDDGTGTNWQSQPIFNVNTFGSAQRPNILIQPIMVFPTSTLLIDLRDESGLANDIEIVLGGYKIFQSASRPTGQRADLWFQYGVRKVFGAGSTDSMTIKLQADSWFEVQKIVGVGLNVALAPANFSLRISDSGLGKTWSDRFIQRDNQLGTAEFPRVLPFPKLIRPNSTVQVEVKDLSGAANTVEVVLEGVKKYSL